MLIAVFGAAAEGRYTGRDIEDVWNGYEAEADVNAARADGSYAGLSNSQTDDFVAEAISRARYLISQHNVWAAVTSVTDNMPDRGEMPGKWVVTLCRSTLGGSD